MQSQHPEVRPPPFIITAFSFGQRGKDATSPQCKFTGSSSILNGARPWNILSARLTKFPGSLVDDGKTPGIFLFYTYLNIQQSVIPHGKIRKSCKELDVCALGKGRAFFPVRKIHIRNIDCETWSNSVWRFFCLWFWVF